MYSLIYDIAEEFDIKPLSVYKCKYYYVLNCEEGTYSLCRARPKAGKIMEIHRVKTELLNMGIGNIDTYAVNRDGFPYTEREGNIYTITRFFGSSELNFMNSRQVELTLRAVGNIHRGLNDIEKNMVYAAGRSENSLMNKYTRELKSMNDIRKHMSGTGRRMWDMDISCAYDRFMKRAEESVKRLDKLGYGQSNTYCHNALKEGNIIYKKGRVYIIDWDNMKHMSYIEDIAFFIKRYIRKNCYYAAKANAEYMDFNKVMKKYTVGNSISDRDYEILRAVMAYPHRFIATVREGCKTGKSFLPSGVRRKLEECIEQMDFEEKYIDI